MKRVNVLVNDPLERFDALTGRTLDRTLDEPLQRLVEEVARELEVPISLVSLVLKRTQFFRAHVGLPPDLAAAQATDRDVSFCQFVVRDGATFEVQDAVTDPRVPKELVEQYGIRAYLGEPIRIGKAVVGSVCAIDVRPRPFSGTHHATLKKLAATVSARLEQLAQPNVSVSLLARGTSPIFGEIRNLLTPLIADLGNARIAVTDVVALTRLLDLPAEEWTKAPALKCLQSARMAGDDLTEVVQSLTAVTQRLVVQFGALERSVRAEVGRCTSKELIDVVTNVALHHTKLVGGIRWKGEAPDVVLTVSRLVGVAVISSALSLLSNACLAAKVTGPIRGSLISTDAQFTVALECTGLVGPTLQEIRNELVAHLGEASVTIRVEADAVCLDFEQSAKVSRALRSA